MDTFTPCPMSRILKAPGSAISPAELPLERTEWHRRQAVFNEEFDAQRERLVLRATLGLVQRIAQELQTTGTYNSLEGAPSHMEVNKLLS